jgi:hypothetical protein
MKKFRLSLITALFIMISSQSVWAITAKEFEQQLLNSQRNGGSLSPARTAALAVYEKNKGKRGALSYSIKVYNYYRTRTKSNGNLSSEQLASLDAFLAASPRTSKNGFNALKKTAVITEKAAAIANYTGDCPKCLEQLTVAEKTRLAWFNTRMKGKEFINEKIKNTRIFVLNATGKARAAVERGGDAIKNGFRFTMDKTRQGADAVKDGATNAAQAVGGAVTNTVDKGREIVNPSGQVIRCVITPPNYDICTTADDVIYVRRGTVNNLSRHLQQARKNPRGFLGTGIGAGASTGDR